MHFGLTEEQELMQQTVRDFAANELPPTRLREIFEAATGQDEELWKGAGELGLHGLLVPEAHGGVGLSLLDLALVFEVFGETVMPGPFLSHSLATLALVHGGSDDQRDRWLPRLATGEAVASVAFAETGDLWDPAEWKLAFTDGRLDGTKEFVEHAADADLIVVGAAGGELALVEQGAEGLQVDAVAGVDQTRSLSRISLADVRAQPLPGGRGTADAVADAGRILLAADAFGAAWKLIAMTVEYVGTREQFGTPLAQFQAVKHQVANLAVESEPLRGLFWYAAHAFDHISDERSHSAAVAKAHVTDRALDVGRSAVELHGGIGFTWECDVQFWVKRTLFDRTWLGSPHWHRERMAALGDW